MPRLTHDEYCLQVCKGKCCVLHDATEGAVRCPNLQENGACGVYQQRYADGQPDVVVVGRYKSRVYKELDGTPADRTFFCGRIEQLLAQNAIPDEVKKQCCYHDERLLEQI